MRTVSYALIASLALSLTAAAQAQTRVQTQTPPPGLVLQKQAPKPDFVILHASAIGGKSDEFMVQVKNDGAVNSPTAKMRSRNMTPGNNGAAVNILPPIKAGQFVWVKVVFNEPVRPNQRILVEADHNKAVAETKENNNNYAFNW